MSTVKDVYIYCLVYISLCVFTFSTQNQREASLKGLSLTDLGYKRGE